MSTAYNAAGEIKDILYDTAHILLLGEHKYLTTLGVTHFSHQRSELVYHWRQKSSNMHLSVIVLGLLSIFFKPVLTTTCCTHV